MRHYDMRELLKDAKDNGYALAAVNVSNMETAVAVLEASSQLDTPVILQIAPLQQEVQGFTYREMVFIIKQLAERYDDGGYTIHLDHSLSHHHCREAIAAGFDAIMFDGAALSYADNIRETAKAREYSRENCLEGELGIVGGNEGERVAGVIPNPGMFTDPDMAGEFVKKTGVDCLAVAIGNAHGRYRKKPQLDFQVLAEIQKKTDIPLVLHGASGIPIGDIMRAIAAGITKINYYTEADEAFLAGFMEGIQNSRNMMYGARMGQERMRDLVKRLIYTCKTGREL